MSEIKAIPSSIVQCVFEQAIKPSDKWCFCNVVHAMNVSDNLFFAPNDQTCSNFFFVSLQLCALFILYFLSFCLFCVSITATMYIQFVNTRIQSMWAWNAFLILKWTLCICYGVERKIHAVYISFFCSSFHPIAIHTYYVKTVLRLCATCLNRVFFLFCCTE